MQMDYLSPNEVVATMIESGAKKATLSIKDLVIRGALSGALLAISTTHAITAATQSGMPISGALIFPVGFVMIMLLGLELITGSFAAMPMALMAKRITVKDLIRNWFWVFIGNFAGSVLYVLLFVAAITMMFTIPAPAASIASNIVGLSEMKTLAYAAHGSAGFATAFVKGMLCNWMVCFGLVMATIARSTLSKIIAAWLPITTFFAMGFEHTVVNMFVIPTGMMLGAKTTMSAWVLYNLIPVTLGNFVGGFLFTGLALYATFAMRTKSETVTASNDSPQLANAPV
jgi:formate/nitrite transporter